MVRWALVPEAVRETNDRGRPAKFLGQDHAEAFHAASYRGWEDLESGQASQTSLHVRRDMF